MAVAKTYEKMELIGEPFQENKKMYIYVAAPKGQKKVRWYSDVEYRRMYPGEEAHNDIMDFNARHAFGFGELGYITIYRGNELVLQEFMEDHHESFRYNLTFGVYTPSCIPICALPTSITPIRLTWEEVMDHDDRMKSHEEVQKYVNSILNPTQDSQSRYQGAENEWLQKTVTVREKKTKDSRYGDKHTYTLVDAENNIYVWETGAKDYALDTTVSLKMKVKEHKEINSEKATIVSYCKEMS